MLTCCPAHRQTGFSKRRWRKNLPVLFARLGIERAVTDVLRPYDILRPEPKGRDVPVADFATGPVGGDQVDLQPAGRGAEADEHRSGIIRRGKARTAKACYYRPRQLWQLWRSL
jgi:hypothetical protein